MELQPQIKTEFGGRGVLPMDFERGIDLDRFTNRPDPNPNKKWQVRKYEQPWHRDAAVLASCNKSQRYIAEFCGKSSDVVCILFKQPWFQTLVLEIKREEMGHADVLEFFEAEVLTSAATLVELRDKPSTPASVRRQCAVDIIERVMGKPQQKVEVKGVAYSEDPVAEVARLERETQQLMARTPQESKAASGVSP